MVLADGGFNLSCYYNLVVLFPGPTFVTPSHPGKVRALHSQPRGSIGPSGPWQCICAFHTSPSAESHEFAALDPSYKWGPSEHKSTTHTGHLLTGFSWHCWAQSSQAEPKVQTRNSSLRATACFVIILFTLHFQHFSFLHKLIGGNSVFHSTNVIQAIRFNFCWDRWNTKWRLPRFVAPLKHYKKLSEWFPACAGLDVPRERHTHKGQEGMRKGWELLVDAWQQICFWSLPVIF